MDATPVMLGQEFRGYATQIRYGIARVRGTLDRLAELPQGGTAVGTGINTPAGFPQKVIGYVAEQTGLPVVEATDHFEAQGAMDSFVETSGSLRTVAVSLVKICNDLRWMGSGPRTGLGEIALPDLQPGSSIMPGKVNPVIPEVVNQVAFAVVGADMTVTMAVEAARQAGRRAPDPGPDGKVRPRGGAGLRPQRRMLRPAYSAVAPSISSMRISWLYLANRSERASEPVLI